MHMRLALTFLVLLFWTVSGMAQSDIPAEKPLKVESKKLDVKANTKTKNTLKVPDALKGKIEVKNPNERKVNMLPTRNLVAAGTGLKIDPKIGNRERNSKSKKHFGDQNLGEITSSSSYVGIVFRDHEYVDGDRVKVSANDQVIEPNVVLSGVFKGVNVDLQNGFNRISFEALNQGSSGPNTAQVAVYDEKGQLIYSNRWNLSTGSKATLVVIKENDKITSAN